MRPHLSSDSHHGRSKNRDIRGCNCADCGRGLLKPDHACARARSRDETCFSYHFRTTDELMQGVVNHIGTYDQSFEALRRDTRSYGTASSRIYPEDEPGKAICGDRLWPQLWAMQDVEPLVSDLVENIYERFLKCSRIAASCRVHQCLLWRRCASCLCLRGTTIFVGEGRRWQKPPSMSAKPFETY